MNYKKTTWVPNETPLSAENFNNMEEGIENATNNINEATKNISKLNLYNENFKTYNLSLLPIVKGRIGIRLDWKNFINDLQFKLDDNSISETCILAEFTNNTRLTLTKIGDNYLIDYEKNSGGDIAHLYSDFSGESNSYTTSEYLIATYIYPNADKTIFKVIRDDDSFQHSITLYFELMQDKHNQSIKTLQDEHSKLNSLTDATEIQIDDDLNKYTTPGNYAFRLNVANVYIVHTPTTERFNLKVYYSVNNNYPKRITQQLTDTNGGIFIRTTSNSGQSWTNWIQLATTKYVDDAAIKTISYLNVFKLSHLKAVDLIEAEIHFIPKQITINHIDLEIHGMYVEVVDIPEAEAVAAIVYLDSFVDDTHCFDMLELWKDGSLNGTIGPYQIQDVPEIRQTAFDAELAIFKCVK